MAKLQREILRSRKWNDLLKRIAEGKKPPKARAERIEITYIPEIFGTCPLATAMRDGIIFNESLFLALGDRLKKRLLLHEMLHAYMIRNKLEGWNDGQPEFATYAHHLGCDVEIRVTVEWRTFGEEKWRMD
jgi:hypothetical protein